MTEHLRQTKKIILGTSLLILLMPSAYAGSLPGDSVGGKARVTMCILVLAVVVALF